MEGVPADAEQAPVCVPGFRAGPIVSQDGFSHCHIKDYHRLEVAAYPHMMNDVREKGLAEFVKNGSRVSWLHRNNQG